ncbi:MAG TPA: alcohol dehydrogenase catalytic domain-containing protein, partial [Thermoanaerobaculia bacterium]
MKAIRIHDLGSPETLRFEDTPDPTPGAGQTLVRLEAIGVNFIDVYQRTGLYKVPSLPFTPGQEAAGTIEAVGSGVTDLAVGDRVAYAGVTGSYAEKAAVPADRLVRLPDGLSAKDGAAAMLQGMTAHALATSVFPLKPGDVCLVHAAAGG